MQADRPRPDAGAWRRARIPLLGWVLPLALLAASALASAAAIRIAAPTPEQSIHDNAGNVEIVVAIEDEASLPPGFQVRLLVDDVPAGSPTGDRDIVLRGIDRGSHRVQAQIVGPDGLEILRSEPVVFHMHQASRLNR